MQTSLEFEGAVPGTKTYLNTRRTASGKYAYVVIKQNFRIVEGRPEPMDTFYIAASGEASDKLRAVELAHASVHTRRSRSR